MFVSQFIKHRHNGPSHSSTLPRSYPAKKVPTASETYRSQVSVRKILIRPYSTQPVKSTFDVSSGFNCWCFESILVGSHLNDHSHLCLLVASTNPPALILIASQDNQ